MEIFDREYCRAHLAGALGTPEGELSSRMCWAGCTSNVATTFMIAHSSSQITGPKPEPESEPEP